MFYVIINISNCIRQGGINVRKITLVLTVLLVCCVGTVWAGGSQEKGAEAEPVASATEAGHPGAPIKLKALIGSWNTMNSTVEERVDFYERRLKAWAEKHPNVYVEIELIPGGQTAQAMTKLLNAALAGDPYDFANIDSQWLGNFHEAGVLTPIDEYVSQETKDQFFDFTKMVTQREGKQYAFWAETGTLLYYYNQEITSEAPETWDDIRELNEEMKSEGKDAWPFMTQGKGPAAAFCLLPMFWAQDGILFDPDDDYRPVFGEGKNKEALVKTLEFYRELIDTKAMPKEIVGYEHTELQTEAKAGNVATMIAGSWVNNALPEGWGYASLPTPKTNQASNIYGGWTFGFMSQDEEKLEASIDFVKEVYVSKEAMAERLPLHGYIPVRKDVFEEPAFDSPFYDQIYKELEVGRARPATSLYPEVESLLEESVGKIIAGNADIEKIVDQMYKKVMDKYEEM